MNEKYLEAVKTIKTAILRSQNSAAKHANAEMLSLYYSIGGYVSGNSREGTWGTGAIDEISSRLREELPGLRGFSAGNIKLMRQFFEAWQPYFQTPTIALPESKSVAVAIESEPIDDANFSISKNRLPLATDFPVEAFVEISFTHHMEILHKTTDHDERVLEKEIINNIRNFIQCLGSGFCFVGNQHRIEVNGDEFFADLLFFQRDLKALVVLELKKGKFKPAYLGQLNFYLSALDEQERKNGENPSIGILLCKEANKSVVELAIRDYTKPMGVATYRTADEVPGAYKVLAPIMEEVPKMLDVAKFTEGGE